MSFVIDASTTLCWAFSEESDEVADTARNLLADFTASAPSLWWFELRNALIAIERRGRITVAEVDTFLAQVAQFSIQIDRTPDEAVVLAFARRHRLTVYDAAYLELAARRGEPLATLDRDLAAAARAESVPLIGAA